MVTGKSQPGAEPFHLPPTPQPQSVATSPPSKRDLASWWRQFKKNTRKEETKENPQGIFGIPLNVSIKYANVAISLTNDNGESFIYGYVPIVVAKCGVFLKEKATDVEGIFRLNGSAKRIKDLQEVFDSPERYGKGLDWSGYTVHDAANVLRRYLNQLPEPIVPLEFYERFREPLRAYQKQVQSSGPTAESEAFDHAKAVAAYQQLIRELPPLNKQLLLYILDLLAVFASKSDQNRMTSANLSAIFQPGLLSHPQHDMSPEEYKLSQDVLIFLIENQDHFLFGMNGTAADEQTVKEVESGGLVVPRTTSHSTVRRSVSSASGGNESFRKFDGLRRNVSVSSKNSRNSNNTASPGGTPSSLSGGVHRSNTLPSKMSPAIPSRLGRPAEPPVNTSVLAPSANTSRSTSREPAREEQPSTGQVGPKPTAVGVSYVHSSKHGPVPIQETKQEPERPLTAKKTGPEPAPLPVSSPPPVAPTPNRERKLSSFFSKSPPPGENREPRQPNRLKKKRIPGSASESAQSSSQSLQTATSDPNLLAFHQAARSSPETNEIGGVTPKAPTSIPGEQTREVKNEAVQNESGQSVTDNSLKPYGSRTPSLNSRSSFTDHSDYDQNDDRPDRKERRRSWRFPRSSKRSNEHIGLGLASPPLIATNPSAERSTSSIGSWHHASRSSPSDLQQFANDPSNQPLSLDEVTTNNNSSHAEPEKRGFFGKFKAKVAQVRDGWDSEREEVKSPVQSDTEKSTASLPMSPPGREKPNGRPTQIDIPKDTRDESYSTPVSPLPGSGLPPPIPEEPNMPESPVSVAKASPEQKRDSVIYSPADAQAAGAQTSSAQPSEKNDSGAT